MKLEALVNIIRLMRVRQWYKNILVFVPVVFAHFLFLPDKLIIALCTFFAFCAIASCTYIINDIVDMKSDSFHPIKKNRPLASGKITKQSAILLIILLGSVTISLCLILPFIASMIIFGYFILNLCYSFYLKQLFIIDVMVIGISFVLRVLAGSESVDVHLSSWLFIATFVLALLLGFSKRSNELNMSNAQNHRKVLIKYDPVILRAFILISTITALIVYLIYAITVIKEQYFILTAPFVCYGLFLFLSFTIHDGIDPDDIFKNLAFDLNLLVWLIMVVASLYVS
jgi:4-hydroxybenzoate polyprenyltransferase